MCGYDSDGRVITEAIRGSVLQSPVEVYTSKSFSKILNEFVRFLLPLLCEWVNADLSLIMRNEESAILSKFH